MSNVSDKTIVRYASIWNKIQTSGLSLSELDKITFNQFKTKTNINTESQFRLAKAFARNSERQEQVNAYFTKKGVSITIIKKAPEVEAIPRIRKIKVKPSAIVKVKVKIPFDQTKFGKITRLLQMAHKISESHAIIHARKILKIDKRDYHKMNQKDVQILLHITP